MEDFGFTHQSSDIQVTDKAEKLMEEFLPFLNKLLGDEDTDTIVWPGKDRHKQINNFIKKLNKIKDGK